MLFSIVVFLLMLTGCIVYPYGYIRTPYTDVHYVDGYYAHGATYSRHYIVRPVPPPIFYRPLKPPVYHYNPPMRHR